MQKRAQATTFKGNPLTLIGPELKVGDKAPDFACLNGDLAAIVKAIPELSRDELPSLLLGCQVRRD